MRTTRGTLIWAVLAIAASACSDEGLQDPCEGLASGSTCTWLGLKGEQGFNGDHHRVETMINQSQDLVFLPDGTAWFSDFNNYLLRRVNTDGTVESMVGWTDPVFPGDGPLGGIPTMGGPGAEWQLNHPTALLLAPDGNLILIGWHNHKVLTIDPDDGYVRVVCGGGAGYAGDGGPAATGARFKQLVDGTFDEAGNLYIVDQQNERVRRIDTGGIITSIAGDGMIGTIGDGGPATMAQFSWAVGSNPNPSGGIVQHEGKLYVSDTEADRIRVIDLATMVIDSFAGTGVGGYAGDSGPANAAQINAPRDLEIGPEGDLYFADTDNGVVRAIELGTGIIRTVVGTGELGLDEAEGLPALDTMLRRPFGIAFDADGNLYVMDTLNSRIVKVAR